MVISFFSLMFSNKTVVIQPFPGVKKQPLPTSAAKHHRDGTTVHYEVCQQLLFQIVIDIIERHQDEQDILTVHQDKKQAKLKLPKTVSGVLSSSDHCAQHLIISRSNILQPPIWKIRIRRIQMRIQCRLRL